MQREVKLPMDVSSWLVKLGFGQYVPSFVDNNIDYQVLCELTDVDLKELGVSSLGGSVKLSNDGKMGASS